MLALTTADVHQAAELRFWPQRVVLVPHRLAEWDQVAEVGGETLEQFASASDRKFDRQVPHAIRQVRALGCSNLLRESPRPMIAIRSRSSRQTKCAAAILRLSHLVSRALYHAALRL